jgi:hypothetical protein
VFFLFCSTASGKSINKTAEWPFAAPTLFLKGGVNAVSVSDDLIFWAVGDTVSVIDKNTFTEDSTFIVKTGTAIQDMLFDNTSKMLFIASGYDSKNNGGGLQVFSLVDPLHPVLRTAYYKSPNNPGALRTSDSESEAVPDIDARGIGLYNNTLFLADDNFGLRVIDISDLDNLTEIPLSSQDSKRISGYKQPDINGTYMTTGGYVGLSVFPYNGKVYAVVLDFYQGVDVFDVTNPSIIDAPDIKDTRTSVWFGSVSLLSDIFVTETNNRPSIYVTGTNSDDSKFMINRLDATLGDSTIITNYGRCFLPGEARGVCASGNYAYIAVSTTSEETDTTPSIPAGLQIVDISSTPSTASEVLTYTIVGSFTDNVDFAYSPFLDGTVLYLATEIGRAHV